MNNLDNMEDVELNNNSDKNIIESNILYYNNELQPEDINIDEILINLKMLSRINPNDKLFMEDNLIKIDSPTIGQGIYRWFQIDLLSHKTDIYIDYLFKKNERNETDNRICQNILVELTKAISGLEKLKITYNSDTFIQSKLDMIQEKFSVSKNNLSQKLQVSYT